MSKFTTFENMVYDVFYKPKIVDPYEKWFWEIHNEYFNNKKRYIEKRNKNLKYMKYEC